MPSIEPVGLIRSVAVEPTATCSIRGLPKDPQVSDHSFFVAIRTIADPGTGTVDVGDIGVLKNRVKPGELVGDLGLHFVQPGNDVPPDEREYKISWIDPAGPAAKTGLQVGDVIASVDGIDVTGAGAMLWWPLVRAAPGTPLALGTRRGVTVTLVLAPP